MKKYLKGITKSQTPNPHASFLSQTFIKFKPFSQDCTILNIQARLQSYRKTATHFRSVSKSTSANEPLLSRIGSIIKGGKQRKRRIFTEFDLKSQSTSHHSHLLDAKIKKIKRRSQTISKYLPTQPYQKKDKASIPQFILRQDLSHLSVQQDNDFFDKMHKPVKSELLVDFNKNNCYTYSRSKQKVIAQYLQKAGFQSNAQPIAVPKGKFQSFSTYYYGTYMKKYKERRILLSKKATLAIMVSK